MIAFSRRVWVAVPCWSCRNHDPACLTCEGSGRALAPHSAATTTIHIPIGNSAVMARTVPVGHQEP